jgi:signal transduction histidine kinase
MNIDTNEAYMIFFIAMGILALSAIILGKFFHLLNKNNTMYALNTRALTLEHEKGLMAAKLEMQELTFQQISQEIHDNIKMSLNVSRLNMENLDTTTEDERQKRINASIELIKKAMHNLDDLSRSLNTDWIKQVGLKSALEMEIDKLATTGLFAIKANISKNRVIMDAERELLIFRIVQEVFNNIIRHAAAKNILFELQYNADHADLTITDDGKGFDYPPSGEKGEGLGLDNIQSRARVLQGRLTIDSGPGKGTMVNLSVPYEIPSITHTKK